MRRLPCAAGARPRCAPSSRASPRVTVASCSRTRARRWRCTIGRRRSSRRTCTGWCAPTWPQRALRRGDCSPARRWWTSARAAATRARQSRNTWRSRRFTAECRCSSATITPTSTASRRSWTWVARRQGRAGPHACALPVARCHRRVPVARCGARAGTESPAQGRAMTSTDRGVMPLWLQRQSPALRALIQRFLRRGAGGRIFRMRPAQVSGDM